VLGLQAAHQINWTDLPRHRFQQRGLMLEATEKIGLRSSKVGKRGQLKISQIKEKQGTFACQANHGVDIFIVREVPRNEGKMRKGTALVVPHELNLGAGAGGTPPCSGKDRAQPGGQGKAGAVREVHLGKGRQEGLVTDGVRVVEPGKGRLEQLL
jgi:hypothetical protein